LWIPNNKNFNYFNALYLIYDLPLAGKGVVEQSV
jgi:hypothetical protein